MAIVNRDLDVSQQKVVLSARVAQTVGASAGTAFPAIEIPFPCTVKALQLVNSGLSGAPTASIDVQRFVVGAGLTTIPYMSTTFAITAFSTSGPQSPSLAASGSSLLNLQTGDVVTLNALFSGGNVASTVAISLVVQALQDIVQYYGSST